MPTLDTEFYNDKIAMLQLESDLISGLEDFQEILDNPEMIESSNEDVRDYIKEGAGSTVRATIYFAKMIGRMAMWCLKMIGKMTKFAIVGFKGTIGRCHKRIDAIADRLPYIQGSIITRGLPIDAVKQIARILEQHANTNIGVRDLPAGNINAAKQYFIAAFNRANPGVGEINANFDLKHKPKCVLAHTVKQLGYTDGKIAHMAATTFQVAEKKIKERLEALRKQEGVVKSVVKQMGTNGYNKGVAKNAQTTETLLASFHAAILARDMKLLSSLEEEFKGTIKELEKRASKVVAHGRKAEAEEETSKRKQSPEDQRQLSEGQRQLPKGQQQLPKGQRQLPEGQRQLPEGQRQLPE